MNPVHTFPPYFFRSILILFSEWSLPLSFSGQNVVCISHLTHASVVPLLLTSSVTNVQVSALHSPVHVPTNYRTCVVTDQRVATCRRFGRSPACPALPPPPPPQPRFYFMAIALMQSECSSPHALCNRQSFWARCSVLPNLGLFNLPLRLSQCVDQLLCSVCGNLHVTRACELSRSDSELAYLVAERCFAIVSRDVTRLPCWCSCDLSSFMYS
jgi:hypothetical protein